MKIKILLKSLFIYLKQHIFANRKQFAKSYVSLFLIMTILVTATFAWFTVKNSANIESTAFKLESSSSLNVSEEQTISNHITIDAIKLDEAGSIDGRNIYFPTNGSDPDSNSTDDLKYREATAGDRNSRYIYKDFTLYGGSSETYVYIKSYSIKVNYANGVTVNLPDGSTKTVSASNPYSEVYNGSTEIKFSGNTPSSIERLTKCPIRVAFIDDSQKEPVVLDASAMVGNYAQQFRTVSSTDSEGNAYTKVSTAHAFSDYYYLTGNAIYTLTGRQQLNGTMVAWLEGASSRSDELRNATISIDIELESVFPQQDIIRFIDNTWGDGGEHSHWIVDPNRDTIVTITYQDGVDHLGNPNIKTVVMKKFTDQVQISSGEYCDAWWAPIPQTVTTNITFNRYDMTDEMIYNAWYTRSNVNSMTASHIGDFLNKDSSNNNVSLETSRIVDGDRKKTYTALRGNGYRSTSNMSERLSPCVGYWYTDIHSYGSGGGGETGGGGGSSSGDEYNVTFYVKIGEQWMKDNYNLYGYTDVYLNFTDSTKVKLDINNNNNNSNVIEFTKNFNKQDGAIVKSVVMSNPSTGHSQAAMTLTSSLVITYGGEYILITNSSNLMDVERG